MDRKENCKDVYEILRILDKLNVIQESKELFREFKEKSEQTVRMATLGVVNQPVGGIKIKINISETLFEICGRHPFETFRKILSYL